MNFEPALIPITPSSDPVEVLYRVPASAREELKEGGNFTVVVDTPYNVIDVSSHVTCHVIQHYNNKLSLLTICSQSSWHSSSALVTVLLDMS